MTLAEEKSYLHRDIGDLMRFSPFVQEITMERIGEYQLPPMERMSDAQLCALALYL